MTVETVRFYERQGLLPTPTRSRAGYRQYELMTVRRLEFIGRAKHLGFTLSEIGELLALRASPGSGCADVQARAQAKMQEIEQKIRHLGAMKRALDGLVSQCQGKGPLNDCPILDALEDGS